jgi:hypothetical protein
VVLVLLVLLVLISGFLWCLGLRVARRGVTGMGESRVKEGGREAERGQVLTFFYAKTLLPAIVSKVPQGKRVLRRLIIWSSCVAGVYGVTGAGEQDCFCGGPQWLRRFVDA